MLNRSIHPLIMGDLNCVTSVRVQHLECMPITHPPEASIARMFFDNIDTQLTIYRTVPEAAGANCAAHETHFVVPNALTDSTVKRLINFDVAIDFDVAASLGERDSPPPRLGSDCFTSANTGQPHRDEQFEHFGDARLSPKANQT